jgi:glycosyltransferase involved in cell wall biosynthesis
MKTILFPIAANSISIVVPVYNSWKSAKRCIESVAAQRVLPREIIIVDDGSATSAPNLLKETLKDCNATFIQFSHQGISAARNSGLNLAKGEMVLFIDSDCILKNSTIEELIATVNQHPLNMTFYINPMGAFDG